MMRRSFSGGGGGGMGGGGAGSNGGGMLRAVQRAVRTGGTLNGAAKESSSHSTTTTAKTSRTATSTTSHAFNNNNKGSNASTSALSLSSSSPFSTLPLSAAVLAPAANTDESEDWECLDGCDDERVNIVFNDYNILGPVPSTDEVQHAVSALQQVIEPSYFSCSTTNSFGYESNEDTTDDLTSSINLTREVLSSSGSVSDWIEPCIHICNSKLLQSYGSNRVYDAFHLLQTEPSIQKMVISLSSDKAVWDAVMNNEAVREIRDSLKLADNGLQAGSFEEGLEKSDSDETIDIISWIVVNTKEKVMEIVEKIIEVVNEWFQPPEKEKTSEGNTDPFDEKLRTSFFLSVVVLLVVVVARAQCA